MKRLIPCTILPALIAAFSLTAGDVGTGAKPARKLVDYDLLPVQFEANVGQAKKDVDFIGRGLHHSLELQPGRALIGTTGQNSSPVQLRLLGSDPAAKPEGVNHLATDIGYYIGRDPAKWLRHVPAFERVRYGQTWPGIDVVYYGTQGRLEYDFVVRPGADPGLIRLGFSGIESLKVDDAGDLLVNTGTEVLKQRKPRVYQKTAAGVQEIAGRYVLGNENTISFELGKYDTAKDLVIDPVLVYAAILDSRFRSGNGVTVDASGNSYFVGQLIYQINSGGATQLEGYMVKVDPIGNQIGTIIYGGFNGPTTANAVTVDASSNVYVVGATSADDIPITGGFQTALADTPNGATDAFLFKLSSSFIRTYATYLGGHGNDAANSVAVDSAGNAYVAGQTSAADFPRSVGPVIPVTAPKGFAAKINTTVGGAPSKVWATLMGGSGTDSANAIVIDGAGGAVVAGSTTSADFVPVSQFGYSPNKTTGGNLDGFINRLNSTGGTSVYFTYWPFGPIKAMAGSGNVVYVTGQTNGSILATASNAYQVSGGANHAFATKVDTSLTGTNSILYSSYLGGSGNDAGLGIAVDGLSRVYVVGATSSTNFPTTAGNIALPSPDNVPDGFYTVLSTTTGPGGAGLVFSTYLGGDGSDYANAVAVDASGNAVITGNMSSSNFIGQLSTGNSSVSVFAMKLGGSGSSQVPTPSSLTPVVSSGASQTYTFQFSDLDGYQDLDIVNVLMNFALDGRNACYIAYSRPQNVLYLVSDDGGGLSALPFSASGGAVSNSQCTITRAGSSVSGSGATLSLTLNVSFSTAFAGNKVVFMAARDTVANNSGWSTMGVRGVPPLPTGFPLSVGMSPSYGVSSNAVLTFNYQDETSANNLQTVWAIMNYSLDGAHACYVAYYKPGNLLLLIPDDGNGSAAQSMVLNGSGGSISNSQCTITNAGSSASASGSQLAVTLNMQFSPSFTGHKAVWMAASTLAGQTTYWQSLGAYLVP